MKRFLILIAVIFMMVNVNAQWFLGGNIGIGVNTDKNEHDDGLTVKENEIGFMLSPKTGYCFNEKLALGVSLDFRYLTFLQHIKGAISFTEDNEYKSRGHSTNYGIYPFIRYFAFTGKNISIILEGSVGVSYEQGEQGNIIKSTNNKTKYEPFAKRSIMEIGVLNITPIIGFKLSEHFQLETSLNFLRLGYNIRIRKEVLGSEGKTKAENINHNFNFGFYSSSGIIPLYGLTIGAIYKF